MQRVAMRGFSSCMESWRPLFTIILIGQEPINRYWITSYRVKGEDSRSDLYDSGYESNYITNLNFHQR